LELISPPDGLAVLASYAPLFNDQLAGKLIRHLTICKDRLVAKCNLVVSPVTLIHRVPGTGKEKKPTDTFASMVACPWEL
jgi:hypothetical protein